MSADGCALACAHTGTSGIIAWLINGTLALNATLFESWQNGSFKSAGASQIYLRGSQWIGFPTSPFAQFAGGSVREYDQILTTTVAALPAASAVLKGLCGSVTDGAASLAWGATVTGGGSAFYEVVCNGSAWTVTGK
jgi:hypothetical protein